MKFQNQFGTAYGNSNQNRTFFRKIEGRDCKNNEFIKTITLLGNRLKINK